MLIRTQLTAAVSATVALGLVAAVLVGSAARDEDTASETQSRAQTASHEVSGLLVLTQEYARHAENRAAQQWHQRHAAITAALGTDDSQRNDGAALHEFRSVTRALPQLFERLEELPQGDDDFTQRRKELLMDQVLTSTQAMSDFAYQWYQEAAEKRREAERIFELLAILMPLTMMAMLVGLTLAVRQRVMNPLHLLGEATAKVTEGDLSVRIESRRDDEFGQLSRRFDEMTLALVRSNEQTRRSQKQLKAVTDNMPALIAYIDSEQVYRFTNAHYRNVFGVEPDSFVGRTILANLGIDAHNALKDEIAGVLNGEHRRFERATSVGGLAFHFMTDYIPDIEPDGGVAGFYVMAADITARKDAELAQMRSERMLRLITDNLPTLISYIDPDQRFRFANAHYEKLLGVSPQGIVGQTVAETLGAEAYAVVSKHLAGALAGERQQFERIAHVAGQRRHLLTDYIPERGDDGRVTGLFAMAVDITALKELQLTHAKDEERVRSILTHAPDAFISIDSAGLIREWNRQAEITFGWKREEVLGRELTDTVIPPEHRAAHSHGMRRFVVTGEGSVINQRIEITALHKDGRSIPIELSVAAVSEGSGYAANAFLRDITQRKLAEALLRDSERRLRDITDNIPAMVGYFDSDERCIFANSTVLRLNGLKREDTAQHTLRSGIGEEAYAIHEPHVRRVLKGEFTTFEGHVMRKGKDAHFQAHLVPDLVADGSVRGFYVMTFDVTAVRRAEIERARSEHLLRAITDNLPVLISYIDESQCIRFANETYRTWLGADPKTLIGMHVRDVVGPQLYEPRRGFLERALAGERVEFENDAVTLGVARTTNTSYIPDVGADGAVRGIYTLSSDVTALKEVERQLQALARFDTLTGLPNRLQFNERLPEALARADRNGDALALMYLDVDRFKSINDSLGHAAGDEVLQGFAKRLVNSVRTTDVVARLAGDEFVIILEGLHAEEEAQSVAKKIIACVNSPMRVGAHDLEVSTSIGIAFHHPAHASTVAGDLLSRADAALYAAKNAGRNTLRMAQPPTALGPSP